MVYNILRVEPDIEPWFAEVNMGNDLYEGQGEAVSNAEVFCCFLTPHYERSLNCKREIKQAADLETKYEKKKEQGSLLIIPCILIDKNNPKWEPAPWLANIIAGKLQIRMKDDTDSSVELLTKEILRKIRNEPSKPTTEQISPISSTFETIREKYLRDNQIKRMVNEEKNFSIEQSYINLAIVETKEQQEKEKKLKEHDLENQPEHEHDENYSLKQSNHEILGSYEEIYDAKTSIDVTKIFEKCKTQTNKVLVLGRAGIGKSTFCQYVTYRWAKREIWSQYNLVILIRLRKLTDSRYPSRQDYSPIDLVKKEYLPFHNLSEDDKDYFEERCTKGKVLWILDGYDEFIQSIPEQLKDVFDHIRETQHHILTSRPYAIVSSNDVKMEIIGFTDENITHYIEQFFDQSKEEIPNASIQGQKLQNFLKSNPNIWGIAHIPVNLELICSLWSNNNWKETKVLTITALYDNITEWVCRRHLRRQNINDEAMTKQTVYKKCDSELKFLEHLAFKAMEYNKIILPPTLLEETENETDCLLFDHPQLLNMGILKSYDDKSIGTHNQTRKHHYFVHLSFQEHFAARHLLRTLKNSKDDTATHLINNNKYKQHFQLVFIFVSGLLAQSYYESFRVRFWTIIQGEPLDVVGLAHIKLLIPCIDELKSQTNFLECAHYLKTISKWFDQCLKELPIIINNHLLQPLQRTTSVVNTTILQNKLLEHMKSSNTFIKSKVCYFVSQLPISEPIPELLTIILDALRDKHSSFIKNIPQALGNIGKRATTTDLIAALTNALQDEDYAVRQNAFEALGEIGEKAAIPEVIVALLSALSDKNSYIRRHACLALGNIGERAATTDIIGALINALQNGEPSVRDSACKALGEIGEKAATPEVITVLINALRDEYSRIRDKTCEALGNIGKKAATTDVIDVLINALQDKYPIVRQYACDALSKIGDRAAMTGVITALLNTLRDEHFDVSDKACEALGKIGENALTTDLIDALLGAVLDKDPNIRRQACLVLSKIGERAATTDVIATLINAIQDEDTDVRGSVCKAFGKIGEKAATSEVIAALINALQDEHPNVRRYACWALGKIGEKAATTDVITALLNGLRDEYPIVRQYTCEALGNIGEKAATPEVIAVLINALQDEYSDVRCYACLAFGKIGEKAATSEVIVALIKMLRDKRSTVRRYACWALGSIGEKAATMDMIVALTDVLQETDPLVRAPAFEALGKIGEKAATANVIAAVIHEFRDKSSSTRLYACEAIGKIGEKVATANVIIAMVDALNRKAFVSDSAEPAKALERAMCSYHAMKDLPSTVIQQLYSCIRNFSTMELGKVPRDQWVKLFSETRNNAWLPLIRYAALLQATAITTIDDRIIVYDIGLVSEFKLDSELMDSFLNFFKSQETVAEK